MPSLKDLLLNVQYFEDNFPGWNAGVNFRKAVNLPLIDSGGQVFNVKSYGATGGGSADDTAGINAALTAGAGKTVYIPPGSYLISSPLIIQSQTTLIADPNATIALINGSACNMLIDSAHNAGTLTVPSAMNNISVIGGIWDRQNNAGTGLGVHSFILGGNNLKIRDLQFQSTGAVAGGKYAICIQNSTNFLISDIKGRAYISDLVHLVGPCTYGKVKNIYGLGNKDDLVAVTPCDNPIGITFGNEGDITDVLIEDIFADGQSIGQGVGIYSSKSTAGTVLNTARIKIRNLHGSINSGAKAPIYIGDFGSYTAKGNIDDIVIDGLDCSVQSNTMSLVNINTIDSADSIGVGSVTIRNVTVRGDLTAIVTNQAALKYLNIEGVTGATAIAPFQVGLINQTGAIASIGTLMLSAIDVTNPGTQGGCLISSSTNGQVLTEVFLENVWFKNFSYLANLDGTTSIVANNVHAVSNANVINAGSAAVITMINNPTCTFDTTTDTITSGGAVTHQFYVNSGTYPQMRLSYNPSTYATLGVTANGYLVFDNTYIGIRTATPTAALQVAGSFGTAITTKSSNYTLTINDSTIIASGAGTTITLPTAVGIAGRQYTIKRSDGTNSITVATTLSQTIDGSTTLTLGTNNMAVTVQSDGANWQVINQVATSIL